MRVIVTDPVHPLLFKRLEEAGMECIDHSSEPRDQVVSELHAFQGIVTRSKIRIDKALIEANPQLRFIGRVGAGMEQIDVTYAQSKGIEVFSSPEGNRQAVAEHALGALLSLFNRIPIADREVRQGHWLRKQNEGVELDGKCVGIIGYGNTGSAFGRLLRGFDVTVLAYDKYLEDFAPEHVRAVEMAQIFERADVVSLHLPLTDETTSLVTTTWIENFQKPFYLINTARGPIVRSDDLLEALRNKKILGACLDVADFETPELTVPDFNALPSHVKELMELENVVFTPHIAGFSKESFEKLSSYLCDKIIARFGRA